MRDLLHYTETGKVGNDALVKEIDKAVASANDDREWVRWVYWSVSTIEENTKRRIRINARLEGLEEGRAEGRKEGLKEGLKEGISEGEARHSALVDHLLDDGRIDDLKHSASDPEFLAALYAEYGL